MKIDWFRTFLNSIPWLMLIGGIFLGYDQRKSEESAVMKSCLERIK